MRALFVALALSAAAGGGVDGCRAIASSAMDTPDARESPQASAQPALLAITPTTAVSAAVPAFAGGETSPRPTPLRGDEILEADPLTKESVGYTLSAVFRQADVIGPLRAAEINAQGLDAARKATELRLAIDLSPSRMRVALAGRGFVVPTDLEIRARSDRYGHVVVWPDGASYRPLAPGSMRALLGERRFDVAPITPAEIVPRDDVGRRIGIRTRKVDVTTRAGEGTFEIGKLDGAAEGGILLCRLLLDLMNAPPGAALCAPDEVPVRAELRWTNKGSLVFELTGSLRRTDVPVSNLLVPPATASFAVSKLPSSGVSTLLDPHELSAFRLNDVEVPPPGSAAGDQLVLVNATIELRLLYLDGIPVAWAAPGARGEVRGLRRGRYVAQWRTFLGDSVEPAATRVVPGIFQVGTTPDAGPGR